MRGLEVRPREILDGRLTDHRWWEELHTRRLRSWEEPAMRTLLEVELAIMSLRHLHPALSILTKSAKAAHSAGCVAMFGTCHGHSMHTPRTLNITTALQATPSTNDTPPLRLTSRPARATDTAACTSDREPRASTITREQRELVQGE